MVTLVSLLTKGEQMVPVLNSLGLHAACVGNHDFDFGEDCLIDLISKTNFPWLLSNFFDVNTKKPMAKAHSKQVIHFNDLRIGVIGLVEQEWIETLNMLNLEDIIYESYVDVGRKLARELRSVDVMCLIYYVLFYDFII